MPDIVLEKLEQFADADGVVPEAVPKALSKKRRKSRANMIGEEHEPQVQAMIQLPTRRVPVASQDMGVFVNASEEDGGELVADDLDGGKPVADDLGGDKLVEDDLDGDEIVADDSDDNAAMVEEIVLEEVPDTSEVIRRYGVRKSERDRRRNADDDIYIYRMSVKRSLSEYGEVAETAIKKELQQMIDKDVFEFVEPGVLTKSQRKSVIRSSMFMKEKFDPSGAFTKLKARLVAGGDQQDKSIYGDISSPTVSLESIMMAIAIAAAERRHIATCDVTGAFLEAEMPAGEDVFMSLDPAITGMIAGLSDSATRCVGTNGCLVVKLKRALYGCVQSSKLWFDKLCHVLRDIGFVANPYDDCVFNKAVDGEQITVCFHVDDLLVTCRSDDVIKQFESDLKKRFSEVTFTHGIEHSFLSMNITVGDDTLSVSMQGYVDKILGERAKLIGANSPGGEKLFEIAEKCERLNKDAGEAFHSDVAKLLYLAKRNRKDILVAVSHLCSRVSCPTEDDQRKLDRIFGYLSRTRDLCTKFKCGVPVDMSAYIDASFGVHEDGASRTGVILMMSGAAVGGWSSKQKLVTKSSTEAELVALSDGSSQVLWAREWLLAQGYVMPATVVYQDNQGVLSLLMNNRHSRQRTRHLNVRYFFIKDRVAKGELQLKYMPTKQMIADVMTKPITGALLVQLRGALLGDTQEQFPNCTRVRGVLKSDVDRTSDVGLGEP